jgi:hypothetical protein
MKHKKMSLMAQKSAQPLGIQKKYIQVSQLRVSSLISLLFSNGFL